MANNIDVIQPQATISDWILAVVVAAEKSAADWLPRHGGSLIRAAANGLSLATAGFVRRKMWTPCSGSRHDCSLAKLAPLKALFLSERGLCLGEMLSWRTIESTAEQAGVYALRILCPASQERIAAGSKRNIAPIRMQGSCSRSAAL